MTDNGSESGHASGLKSDDGKQSAADNRTTLWIASSHPVRAWDNSRLAFTSQLLVPLFLATSRWSKWTGRAVSLKLAEPPRVPKRMIIRRKGNKSQTVGTKSNKGKPCSWQRRRLASGFLLNRASRKAAHLTVLSGGDS